MGTLYKSLYKPFFTNPFMKQNNKNDARKIENGPQTYTINNPFYLLKFTSIIRIM